VDKDLVKTLADAEFYPIIQEEVRDEDE